MKFSMQSLALLVLLVAVIFGLGVSIEQGARDTGRVEPGDWPPGLSQIAKDHNIPPSRVDVRYGGEYLSVLWKVPATDSVLADHLRIYDLQSVATNSLDVDLVRSKLPYPWRWPGHSELACYAQPVGNPVIGFRQTQVVLVHDQTAQELIVYHYHRLY